MTWSTKTIIDNHPESTESDVGADSWQRTGVNTFSKDQKETKRITFSKIQQKFKDHYGRHFNLATAQLNSSLSLDTKDDSQVTAVKVSPTLSTEG